MTTEVKERSDNSLYWMVVMFGALGILFFAIRIGKAFFLGNSIEQVDLIGLVVSLVFVIAPLFEKTLRILYWISIVAALGGLVGFVILVAAGFDKYVEPVIAITFAGCVLGSLLKEDN